MLSRHAVGRFLL